MSFDIVIPLGPNDFSIISDTIEHTKKNVKNYRNIYIVSKDDFNITDTVHINENIFPFNLEEIGKRVQCLERAGWYLQQLIKLTAGKYIPDILDKYLVLDSDVYILKELEFIDIDTPLYSYSNEDHIPYFEHMARLHPTLTRQKDLSGICHHMMFDKNYINKLFELVETYKNKSFTDAFLDEVTVFGPGTSGASEYEIYFNFMIFYYPDKIKIRKLHWANICNKNEIDLSHDFVAIHHYCRK
jgi:hypothetical protein